MFGFNFSLHYVKCRVQQLRLVQKSDPNKFSYLLTSLPSAAVKQLKVVKTDVEVKGACECQHIRFEGIWLKTLCVMPKVVSFYHIGQLPKELITRSTCF